MEELAREHTSAAVRDSEGAEWQGLKGVRSVVCRMGTSIEVPTGDLPVFTVEPFDGVGRLWLLRVLGLDDVDPLWAHHDMVEVESLSLDIMKHRVSRRNQLL